MRNFALNFALAMAVSTPVWAITLEEASNNALENSYNYDVLFTNPDCDHAYTVRAESNNGRRLRKKPKGAWCDYTDMGPSGARESSPQHRLISWINDPNTKEIFFTYLSISNGSVTKAIVDNIKERGLKVTFIFDHPNFPLGRGERLNVSDEHMAKSRQMLKASDLEDEAFRRAIFEEQVEVEDEDTGRRSRVWKTKKKAKRALQILQAKPEDAEHAANTPTMYLRGHSESSLKYAHNKLFIVNPNSDSKVKLSFSSGNLSSGVVTHHENWHFVTLSPKTYFYQAHKCLVDGMIDHGLTNRGFSNYISSCKAGIEYEEEEDIKTFWVPGEGEEKALNQIKAMIDNHKKIYMAAHRFSYGKLINYLKEALDRTRRRGRSKIYDYRLVVDDDLYWVKHEADTIPNRDDRNSYPNSTFEYGKVQEILGASKRTTSSGRTYYKAKVRYMETNHWFGQVHHNKFILALDRIGTPKAVFCGAGNFTGTAFDVNYENFYYITIPSVVKAFKKQYSKLWKMASTTKELPKVNMQPNGAAPSH